MQVVNRRCMGPAFSDARAARSRRTCGVPRASTNQPLPKLAATHCHNSEAVEHSRRGLLVSGLLLASTIQAPPSWSAVSSRSTLCTQQSLEDSAVCRAADLERDAGKQQDYSEAANRKGFVTTQGVPVAQLDGEYAKATLDLAEKIERYADLDVYDKSRIGFVKDLKGDGLTWVSKYARGGSVRSQSARRMYIAVDALLGHLAANGLAPYPAPKFKKVQAALNETRQLLYEGK